MVVTPRRFWFTCLLGAFILLATADGVFAGWMGFQNQTKDTIIVQEAQGRPQRLFSGESTRDNTAPGGQKSISIIDPKNPNKPLYTGTFATPSATENILYVIKMDAKGAITVETVKTPVQPVTPPKKK